MDDDLLLLTRQLKQLKLSGLAETLEMRLAEAERNSLDYRGLLTMLLQDELEKRGYHRTRRLVTRATFGAERTFESFDVSLATGLNPTLLRELSTCAYIHRGEGVVVTGPPGTGKTHLAKALGHVACRRGLSVRFFPFTRLFAELARARLRGIETRFLRDLMRTDLLILDEFAFRRIDQAASEAFYEIVDARYGSRSTILTSNRAMTDWMGVFPDPVIAGAILDRLTHHAHQIQLKGESIRKKLGRPGLTPPVEPTAETV